MIENNVILAKESISDENGNTEINEVRPLSDDEIEEYNQQKNIMVEFANDFMLVEYVKLNYESLIDLLEETVIQVAESPTMMGPYPFKNFPFLLNTRILNYMMSVKTLLDHMETNINRKHGEQSNEFIDFKALLSHEYDNYFSYRFMYRLRNFVQHCGMPPLTYTASKSLDEANSKLSVELNVYFLRDQLIRKFSKWGSQVKSEIIQMEEEFPILPILNEHVNTIYKIFVSYNEKYNLPKCLYAKESIVKFIGEKDDYVGDEYIIAKFESVESGLSLRKITIPTSSFIKITDFYKIKDGLL